MIGCGGALGATCRWAMLERWPVGAGQIPWTVLVANVVGSYVVGVALAEQWTHPWAGPLLRDGIGVGFCGGLTTMSTFALEAASLARSGHVPTAVIYTLVSVAIGIAAVIAGGATGRRLVALSLPLEGP